MQLESINATTNTAALKWQFLGIKWTKIYKVFLERTVNKIS
jgi:hypothetical protein